jgi:phosphatidylglycerophosphate synthase
MQVSGAMRGTSATAAGTRPTPSPLDHPRTQVATGVALVLACTATVAIAFVLARLASGDLGLVERALVYALLGAGLLAWLAARHHAAPAFGAANAVTLARGVLVLDLLAVLGEPNVTLAWVCVALALLALGLDGVDGKVARSRGEVSAFGARFDMETDAALILVLCALAWQQVKVGPWILLAGALRYLFVAAGFALPRLARALPPSRRRQAACVAQIASLIVCLLPVVAPPISGAVALIGLVALVGSFAADVGWLARARA